MTPIDEMHAGEEMDALVAEKVMGWVWEQNATGSTGHLIPPNFTPYTPRLNLSGAPIYVKAEFSTNIDQAWEIVEKFQCGSISEWQKFYKNVNPSALIGYSSGNAARAICQAALKTIE